MNSGTVRPTASCRCASLEPGQFGPCLLEVRGALPDDEARRAGALFLCGGASPALDDLCRNVSPRELARDVHAERVTDLIASQLLEIGHGLGIDTIVEGVEKPEEPPWAGSRGADYGQGFHIARPEPSPGPRLQG